ncbi:MAG: DNA polymerase III subunit alpha [Bacteroidetes bacterium]|nr:DNA polymerase III subunit alpha [Bacteroidota bacterium]MBV6460810.1 DNA polymerase III subunit alpha [Flavobacteriales bacterium]WKZ75811.1 MAG: DNA polymerase III subunit alpha [Vicingaceae bacterium]MCL4816645.1 DNA polymerase III subunit alpha [Flavobacteriales bacterium]NOG95689.1 DNA polymerase III subunit alpha [Bacteroidota bacterium]
MPSFSHLHVHTQFSLLDGASNIAHLYQKAVNDKMPALAITDHGNMFGVFNFVAQAEKHNPKDQLNVIKPIVGCEFYVVADRHKKQFTKDDKDVRYHQLLIAKNAEGYTNLSKLCSLGYIEGLYGKYPRIDKELILKYHKGLIATSCCLAAEIPRAIIRNGEADAEEKLKWWLNIFGEDFYIELQRHDIPEQIKVNEVLLKFALKHNVKVIASNDSHYVEQQDANAHDILLCINTGEKQSTPTLKDFADNEISSKGKRFAFYNDQFYFKNTQEMSSLFSDIPQAIDNTNEIVDKVEHLKLKRDILLPNFPVPIEFQIHEDSKLNQWEYLKHLTFLGAKERYKEITAEVEERINFELFIIKTMGFAGYFLIVADFIKAGKELGVFVGPGRGSAAGSVVAYCTKITNIDPIKYRLLFERFLNPDRKSMPDIDTDFDDEGRQKVIDYVVEKYGYSQVAQIVTYGTMAAKMSIKDVARVLDLPLNEANSLAKLVPDKPGISLQRIFFAPLEGKDSLKDKDKENLKNEDIENIRILREKVKASNLEAEVLREAIKLEGSVRNTGIHAAGIIIAPKDLTEIIPVCTSKESNLLITQYEGKIIEEAGVIKMDFLGLKNLTIIRDALKLIKENHDIEIDIDNIPLDDTKTFELFQRAETNGVFQFESAGMQKHLKDLVPDKLEDLIAMNALYRPGPMAYIPDYILRKHGKQEIIYDLPEMKEYLEDTFGITVYQEQVMLLAQKLADFTKGDADYLRKAMGKKNKQELDKLKDKFIGQATAKGYELSKLEKIWNDWEAFAQYAFNKSHSTCYALVAYQTAYLKANYAAEYMASILTHNLSNIDKVSFFMEECNRMGIAVLGPDINESKYHFSVNQSGEIRFGLGAIKGVGEAAVIAIVEEREKKGKYISLFDLCTRVNLRSVNKKTFESLAYAGAFDSLCEAHRAQFFFIDPKEGTNLLEKAIRYGNTFQDSMNSSQQSLFGEVDDKAVSPLPLFPVCEPWSTLEKLNKEKEVVGFFISGHPLDDYRFEIENFVPHKLSDLKEPLQMLKKDIKVAGIISSVNHRISKNGKPYGNFVLEDYTDTFTFVLFGDDYLKYRQYIEQGWSLYVCGKMETSRFNNSGYDFRISNIEILSNIKDKFTKAITLHINQQKVNQLFVEKLTYLVSNNPGNCTLQMVLKGNECSVALESRSKKINVEMALYNELKMLSAVEKITINDKLS